ncbi:phage minor capsid protein [Enterococcus cecorum]|uniref:phage minor capsid protein n=1 Tax=Enterococcus cecorum TaxID=44008 RepID=UPI002ACAB6B9|nr:phage minor capsid protein [Enterococcus cecorum]MDZ5509524.1 phage minor capsid protein [Enterococcus cecorum]
MKKPALNDEQFMLEASQVADLYHQLTLDLFDQVVERIKERGTQSLDDNPYLWQAEKLQQMGLLNDENVKMIAERSGIAEEQLRYVLENEGLKIYEDTRQQIMEATGNKGLVTDNSHIQTVLSNYVSQAMFDIDNLINTTLPKSVIGAYQGIVEESVAKVVTGLATHDQAINQTVMKWFEKGFYGFTDKAGKRWKADNYARTVIKSTAYRVKNEMRMRPAEELGIDTFYYSMKAAAREMCAPLQHQIVTTGNARTEKGIKIYALSDYGYGSPGGCQGINCGHTMTPFIPGVNRLPELNDELKDITPEKAIENANIQSKQRALEREIRHAKEQLYVANQLDDKELIDKYSAKVRSHQATMRAYIKKNPFLYRDYAREKYNVDPFTKAKEEIKIRKELKELEKHRSEQKEMRRRFNSAVKDGIIKTEINEQKQADHIRGTNEWKRRIEVDQASGMQFEPSYLTISMDEAAELIKRYSGTGKFLYKEKDDYIPKKEIIKHDSKIGVYIDRKTGERFDTDSFRIHYRNTGAHIVPTYGGKS